MQRFTGTEAPVSDINELDASMDVTVVAERDGVDDSESIFRDLYARHHRAVLAYLLRRTDTDVAFDAACEVFLVAWRRLSEVPPIDSALPWLYAVARRVLANERRRASRLARLTDRIALNPPDPPQEPSETAIVHLESEAMLKALRSLSERDQEVLRLTYWEELPHADIALILGCTTEAVHVRRHRAVRHLANALNRRGHRQGRRPVFFWSQEEEGL